MSAISSAQILDATQPGENLTHWHQNSAAPMLQQYALPIHQTDFSYSNGVATPESRELTPRAENTLRRKTPNGTLNAGYDGSGGDVNPQKHQVVQLGQDADISRSDPFYGSSGKRTYTEHYNNENNNNSNIRQRQQAPQFSWQGMGGMSWPISPGAHTPSSFPVMDSMLNQMPMQAWPAQQYYGQTVPSVLQPSLQYIGPTASGGQGSGPYGPYWHDGTFVPYRPAALRDPRFYQYRPPANWSPFQQTSQYGVQSNAWQTAQHPLPGPLHAQDAGYYGSHAGHASQPGYHHSAHGHTHNHDFQTSTSRPRHVGTNMQAMLGHPYGNDEATASGIRADFGSTSRNGQRRDKTFAWALQQYKELLTFIHQTRRQQFQSAQAGGPNQNTNHRPSFYPRPPCLSKTRSAIAVPKREVGSSQTISTAHLSDPPMESESHPGDVSTPQDDADTPKARSPSVWSPSGVHMVDNEYKRRASCDQDAGPQQVWPYSNHDRHRTLRRSTGSSISPILTPLPQDDSPPSRAAIALSHITKLCQETDWQWTDGMHLGGCLAYGLGNYQKALRWYNKVLEMDPKHLEATSNLAATLLALGRRQEAEQHWIRVMKTAPNHFEAVEHLVGLLCNQHRTKDAIKVIEYVERMLRQPKTSGLLKSPDRPSEYSPSTASRSPAVSDRSDKICYDFEADSENSMPEWRDALGSSEPGFGSSGFAIPGTDNGRILALIHAKGNMLYGTGDNGGAARAFEDAVLIAAGRSFTTIQGLVDHILFVVAQSMQRRSRISPSLSASSEPILLSPEQALQTARLCFPFFGELPGLQHVPGGPQSLQRKAVISTTSNSLLSLAKIFQDGMSNPTRAAGVTPLASGVRDILALYYLSLSLQPSPSTANNVGILLASVQQVAVPVQTHEKIDVPGVIPGSGIALALQYYNYGLQLDQHHAHLYTNLGSLLKDIGQLDAAITMYERAVKCDGKFDIALANLANAVKDKGRISDAIVYYRRAAEVSPDFAEAVCGLANALNSVCGWKGRGGIVAAGGKRDRWHVDANGMLLDAKQPGASSTGWIKRVVEIVAKQLVDGENWGIGTLTPSLIKEMIQQVMTLGGSVEDMQERENSLRRTLKAWSGRKWEGARVTRLVERATKRIAWHWYRDTYVHKKRRTPSSYSRPQLPATLTVPSAPTVLPFHTFTCPMSAKQIRLISQRNALRISVCALRAPWLPKQVFQPPKPPAPRLRVGYVSSDFNNHPLAHLMQSVFGLHDQRLVEAYCYATTASDNSVHRRQIQAEAPVFHDASGWSAERLVHQIVRDGIHILVNLNGYTRGARNEIFAARPAPIQMSFMGFAGTLGAEWCDYLLADETAIPPETLRPWRRNIDLEDQMVDENMGDDNEDWIYGENIIYCRDTFFCCDHRQSAPDAQDARVSWDDEQQRRWQMRRELFPQLADETIVFGNFNQLYKIEPTTFRTWLRILARVPNSILWLLRFPDLGESHLLATARQWAGAEVASRVIFTDVAPKHLHISRARVCDLVLDTPECNAHTTAADVLWSGTPLLTLPRYPYKMCSRMAASILKGALPKDEGGKQAARELVATDEEDYEEKAVSLGKSLTYASGCGGVGHGRLVELRQMLFDARWTSGLFDTKRWVRDLELAYVEAWRRWVVGQGGDIWLEQLVQNTT